VAGALAATIAVVAACTGSLWHEVPRSVAGWGSFGWPALIAGRWWTAASSLFLTRDPFMALTMPLAVVAALGAYERRAGPWRALAVAVVGHMTGSVVVALGAGALGRTGWPVGVRAAENLDYGASMVVAAALGALASRTADRRIARLVAAGVVGALVFHHQLADWAHLVAAPAGFASDRARRPRLAVVALAMTGVLTAWLALDGAQAVVQGTDAVRFEGRPGRAVNSWGHPGTPGTPVRAPGSVAVTEPPGADRDPVPRGRLTRLDYRSPALGDRTMVAWVYVPAHPGPRLPVVVFLHGIPGTPDDWLAGGDLVGQLDGAVAAGSLPPLLAVIPDGAGMHDPRAGWKDIPRQHLLTSLRRDLLPALADRYPVDLDPGRVAVVGVDRGGQGAARLSRLDPRVGYAAALDPGSAVRAGPGVRLLVDPGGNSERPRASETWERWRGELPGVLRWLGDQGFGGGEGGAA
jgi:hypothetical protein